MKSLYWVIVVLSTIKALPLYGQDGLDFKSNGLTVFQVGQIKIEAISLISEFSNSYELGRKDFSIFKGCFTPSCKLPNDILPLNRLDESLELNEYIELRKLEKENYPRMEVYQNSKIIKFKQLNFDPNSRKGTLFAHVNRTIEWDREDSKLNSMLTDTFVQIFEFEFEVKPKQKDDLIDCRIKIAKISNQNPLGRYGIFQAEEKATNTYEKVTVVNISKNGEVAEKIFTNWPDSTFFLKRIFDKNIQISSTNSDYFNVSNLNFDNLESPEIVRFRPPDYHAFIAIGGNLFQNSTLQNPLFSCNAASQFHLNVGFGKLLYYQKKYSLKGSFNLGYSDIYLKANLPYVDYSYNSRDIDLSLYKRIIQLTNLKEDGFLSIYSIGFGINMAKKQTEKRALWLDLGAKYAPMIQYSFESVGRGFYSGFYENLFGLTISENDIYDFGQFSLKNTQKKINLNKSFFLSGGIGLDHKVRKDLALRAGVNFLYSPSFLFFNESSTSASRLSSTYSELNSLFSSTPVKSFFSYWFSTGLIYSFYGKGQL
jgi:hypothetical protein